MSLVQLPNGCPYGGHRVLDPPGALPQPAHKLDNRMDRIWDNEILVDVESLNIDSASFSQIKKEAAGDRGRITEAILKIVSERGKMQNPVTGSGGMFIGQVAAIGERLAPRDLRVGDRIASLVSLSLTPLAIDEILEIKTGTDQARIRGKAVLFESGIYCKLPDDIPAPLALAVLDVCGAPMQTARLAKDADIVVILGAPGKSGVLCAYAARRNIGLRGKLFGVGIEDEQIKRLEKLGLCDAVLKLDAADALGCRAKIAELTGGKMADLVINCVNVPMAEMASILMCKDGGSVYFFSMATSFARAALGAEGVGKDVTMLIGNGYARGHAEFALNILRESPAIRELYESLYCR